MSEGRSGYLASAGAFAAITAAWALMTRDDVFYGDVDIGGFAIPATMIAYLVAMPLVGFLVGRWRYEHHDGASPALLPKLGARAVHFVYAHLLLVLFTAAMAAEAVFGANLDAQVRAIDAGAFDLAERFTPWLAAYLTGFNLGRYARANKAGAGRTSAPFAGAYDDAASARGEPYFESAPKRSADGEPQRPREPMAPHHEEERRRPGAATNPLRDHAGHAHDADGRCADDHHRAAAPARRTEIAAPAWPRAANDRPSNFAFAPHEDEGPGFLPPQDLDALRPDFRQLR
jgi:hypothetical protein